MQNGEQVNMSSAAPPSPAPPPLDNWASTPGDPPHRPAMVARGSTPLIAELRILIVDESSADRLLLRTALLRGTSRYQIFEAAEGGSAVDLTQRYRPDAIILDYRLPGQDGISLMTELSKLHSDGAFLIITRQGDEAAAVRAMKSGAADYLVKDQVLRDPIRLDRAVQAAVYTKSLERENERILEALRQRNLELEQLNKKLWVMSHTDELTSYFNRRYIQARLDEEILRSSRYKLPLSIVLVDLDHFKRINDTYGHLAGDRALQAVAHLIRSALRDTDLIGRFGGEEFLLILTNTDLPGAAVFCHRLCERIQHHPICVGETMLSMTASFGIAALSDHHKTATELLRIADKNLYRAKEAGRNRVVAGLGDSSDETFVDIS
ncbi:MAG TPA: diguanylate cyclase [Gemmatales bacterium]|nr:diguanylate cyclase [Gemmatales bacterium]